MGIQIDKKALEKELNRIDKKFDRAGYEFDRTMENGLSIIAEGLIEKIRRRAPIDSGNLRDSMNYEVNSRTKIKTIDIYSISEYFDVMDTGFEQDFLYPANSQAMKIPKKNVKRLGRLSKTDKKSLRKYGGIMRDHVETPEVRPRSKKGPNMFFTGSISEISQQGEKGIRALTDDAFKRSFSARG